MENCLYKHQRICSFEIINEFDIKLYPVINEWKKAGDNNELKCEECNQPVVLRAGDTRIPHFAHKPGAKLICSYGERDTEDHRSAKKFFYQYFRRHYPVILLDPNHKFPSDQRCDLFVTFPGNHNLIIEYLGQGLNAKEFHLKNNYYKSLGIPALWFLGTKAFQEKSSKGFLTETMLNEGNRVAYILDIQNETILIMKFMEYQDSKTGAIKFQELFQEKYPLSIIKIEPSGKILSPFDAQYEKAYTLFMKDCLEAEAREEKKRRLNEERLFERQKREKEVYAQRVQEKQTFPSRPLTSSRHSPALEKREEWLEKLKNADLIECEKIFELCRVGLINVLNRKKRVPQHTDYYSMYLKKCENIIELAKRDGERANLSELRRRLADPLADLL